MQMKKAAEEVKDLSNGSASVDGSRIGTGVGNGNEEGGVDGNDSAGPELQSTAGDVTTFTTSELPVPKSMANRNKKRGFMKEMNNVQGTKTVFGADAQASSTPVAEVPTKDGNESTMILTPQLTGNTTMTRRVLPPSEMDLPNNVFVTHQVYDRHGWKPRGRAARHRAENAAVEEEVEEEEQEMDLDVEEDEVEDAKDFVVPSGPVGLPHGAVDLFTPTKGYNDDDNMWTKAEERFDDLPIIHCLSQPAKGSIIAWKVCSIDDPRLELMYRNFNSVHTASPHSSKSSLGKS